jgi:hypothetical protein
VTGGVADGLRPVALVLEGVGGQVDSTRGGEHGGPVRFHTGHEQPAHGVEDGLILVTILAQQRNQNGLVRHRLPRHRGQHPVRSDLHEPCHAGVA